MRIRLLVSRTDDIQRLPQFESSTLNSTPDWWIKTEDEVVK